MMMHVTLNAVLTKVREPPAKKSFWGIISWLKTNSSLVEPSLHSKIASLVKMRAALVVIVAGVFVAFVADNASGQMPGQF